MKNKITSILHELINDSIAFGLAKEDIENCKEFLEYHEYGLCLDTIITQLDENNIRITEEFFKKVQNAGIKLKINSSEYDYLKDKIS